MSPLRWDVLGVAFVLALPLLLLGLRGDFTAEEVTLRLPWCLAAGWVVVAVVRFAVTSGTPPQRRATPEPADDAAPAPADTTG
ncbi:hypothetical protein [Blastococcus sp. CCUG 61487]|uniref:hypothetical protein n=1 Tax=Blastococcus sp. CCUG 61487 TaxID=1840703 RepID=UPI0010C102C9|nr:hypothetical protein [Blastococcus sp. CCUG 61487]TKJ18817.1 hypothetical protein A6V29_11140 [Blastococcus sp. CCUG 61487]